MYTHTLIALIGSCATAFAATAAWISANRIKKTVWSQIILQITSEYSSKEMFQSINKINNWKKEHGEKYAQEYATRLSNDDPEAIEIDYARRRCSHYYDRIWKLINSKVLKADFVKKIILVDQIDFFLNTIEPMEHARNPHYDPRSFNGFRKIYENELKAFRQNHKFIDC